MTILKLVTDIKHNKLSSRAFHVDRRWCLPWIVMRKQNSNPRLLLPGISTGLSLGWFQWQWCYRVFGGVNQLLLHVPLVVHGYSHCGNKHVFVHAIVSIQCFSLAVQGNCKYETSIIYLNVTLLVFKAMPAAFWTEQRHSFTLISNLVGRVDEAIAVITTFSISNNMYFILLQLLNVFQWVGLLT